MDKRYVDDEMIQDEQGEEKLEQFHHTFSGLIKWHKCIFKKVGWMILAQHEGHEYKIKSFMMEINHFLLAVEAKFENTNSADKRQDLLVIHHEVTTLLEKLFKIFQLEKACN